MADGANGVTARLTMAERRLDTIDTKIDRLSEMRGDVRVVAGEVQSVRSDLTSLRHELHSQINQLEKTFGDSLTKTDMRGVANSDWFLRLLLGVATGAIGAIVLLVVALVQSQ